MIRRLVVVVALCVSSHIPAVGSAHSINDLLREGKLADAQQLVEKQIEEDSEDALAQTQLGLIKLLQSVERLGQSGYRMGTGHRWQGLMFFRIPVPSNKDPEVVSCEDVRQVIQQFITDLAEVDATLAKVGDREVFWKIDLAKLSVDLNGDQEIKKTETLFHIFKSIGGRVPPGIDRKNPSFVVGLDTGDVYWLRGYCNALSSLGEFILAYDQQRMFDHVGYMFFPKVEARTGFFHKIRSRNIFDWRSIADLVALVHLVDWPLKEPERLEVAHQHLLKVVELSRLSWAVILKETDNNKEWMPNPNQQSVLPNATMTQERIDTWLIFLDEATDLLNGKKLVPFWRNDQKGVNLHRAFHEPTRFDLILWIQGSAAIPYLEEGEQTKPETWENFQRVFRGQFIGFAFWIN